MKKYLIANWKLNPSTPSQAQSIIRRYTVPSKNSLGIVVCPPAYFLPALKGLNPAVQLGAQDCFWESQGAYTGGLSPLSMRYLGARFVILGHSERREYWNETDDMINRKLHASIKAGLTPVLCVGGGREARTRPQEAHAIALQQLDRALAGLQTIGKKQRILIAYEPAWAISTVPNSRPETPEEVDTIALSLAAAARKIAGYDLSVIYGGSVTLTNADTFVRLPSVSGLLVGAASLRPAEFNLIIQSSI